MASQTLEQALDDERTLHSLQHDPGRFRFHDPVHLVVATKHAPPNSFVESKDDGSFTASGPLIDTVEVLAKSMNFTYTLVQPADLEWGAQMPNGTWTGLVGMVMRNDADMVAATVCRSEARNKVVDYTHAVIVARGQLLAPNGSLRINPWSFVNPLQPTVWLGLFLSLIGVWITVLLLERKPKHSSYSAWIQNSLFNYLRVVLNQSTHQDTRHEWKRLLTGAWMCLSVVLFWSYNCSLISLLSSRIIARPIQSLQDLVDHPSMGLVMEKNAIFSSFVEKATFGVLMEARKLRDKGRLLYLRNDEIPWGTERYVRRGSHVLLIDNDRLIKFISDDFSQKGRCDFYLARESLLPFTCGIITKKGNPIIPAINYRLGILESSGIYQHWRMNWFINSTTCINAPTKMTVQEAFSPSSVWGMLVVWISGIGLAMLTFFIELIG